MWPYRILGSDAGSDGACRSLQLAAKDKGLRFDISKTELFHFPGKKSQSPIDPPWAVVGPHQVLHNLTMRWLGVFLQDNGRPSHHTKVRAGKAAKALAMIKPYITRMRQTAASRAVNGLVIPILSYGLEIWAGQDINAIDLAPIQRVIRSAALAVKGAFFTSENHASCAEANISSAHVLVETVNLRAVGRLHNLPTTHPLHSHKPNTRPTAYIKSYLYRQWQVNTIKSNRAAYLHIDAIFNKSTAIIPANPAKKVPKAAASALLQDKCVAIWEGKSP
ncbi:MAG: hypothetical protein L6R37_008143 [Teloschistes peruensis]|nr:MAG: hypothetical protein L6R37_008143 [Teloschistes peruensis]